MEVGNEITNLVDGVFSDGVKYIVLQAMNKVLEETKDKKRKTDAIKKLHNKSRKEDLIKIVNEWDKKEKNKDIICIWEESLQKTKIFVGNTQYILLNLEVLKITHWEDKLHLYSRSYGQDYNQNEKLDRCICYI